MDRLAMIRACGTYRTTPCAYKRNRWRAATRFAPSALECLDVETVWLLCYSLLGPARSLLISA